jgi:hypothetical protein
VRNELKREREIRRGREREPTVLFRIPISICDFWKSEQKMIVSNRHANNEMRMRIELPCIIYEILKKI